MLFQISINLLVFVTTKNSMARRVLLLFFPYLYGSANFEGGFATLMKNKIATSWMCFNLLKIKYAGSIAGL